MAKLNEAQSAALRELAQVVARDERSSRLKPKSPPPPVDESKPAQAHTPEEEAELSAMFDEIAAEGTKGN